MDTKGLYELIEQLKRANDIETLESLCGAFCSMTNIKYYLIGIASSHSLYSPTLNLLTNYPEAWMDGYRQKNKRTSDPIVELALSRNTPIFWSDLEMLSSLSTEQRQLMKEAKEFGLVNGLSIPIHSVSGDFSVFSLVVDTDDEESKQRLQESLPFAYLFSNQLFEQYLRILSTAQNHRLGPPELTNREQECLFWACEGKTAWEISQILDIKERTIVFHLNNATTKLGAINRQHAVVLAIKRGIVSPNI